MGSLGSNWKKTSSRERAGAMRTERPIPEPPKVTAPSDD